MKTTEFFTLCAELLIAPAIALENENLRAALRARDDKEVRRILMEDF